MFEKEAEEYYYKTYPVTLNIGEEERYKEVTDIWKDGAEFGYNKAFVEADKNLKAVVADFNKVNEWHYVKDGDLPTHSNGVLVFTDEGVGFGLYGLDDKKWHTYDTGFDVIAWCEIPTFDKE